MGKKGANLVLGAGAKNDSGYRSNGIVVLGLNGLLVEMLALVVSVESHGVTVVMKLAHFLFLARTYSAGVLLRRL